MKTFEYTITDPVGIHARPAGELVKEAKKYEDTITVTKGDKSAEAKRLMALLGLCVVKGDTVTVSVEGVNEASTVVAIEKFFKENL